MKAPTLFALLLLTHALFAQIFRLDVSSMAPGAYIIRPEAGEGAGWFGFNKKEVSDW